MAAMDRKMLLYMIAVCCVWQWRGMSAIGISVAGASDSVLGCTYNDTRYANGSFVPTTESCLNCKCINANLICALRVCPEQPFPPPRGCVIVQKRDSCCPYMTCSNYQPFPKDAEKRTEGTHDAKWTEQNLRNRLLFGQNAVQRRIDETDDAGNHQFGNGKMCVHNGTVYRSGSAMTTSSLCSYCYCIEGVQKCVEPKCTLPPSDCEPISIDSSCCPVRYDCTENKSIKAKYNAKFKRRRTDTSNKHFLRMTSRMQRSRGCLVNSNFYPEGHRLPRNETNPCEICFCIGGTKRCTPKKCAPMIRNCRPIVPDGQCCPSSYDCNYKPKVPTAREFAPRQLDFFSLFFSDDSKENATTSWDYETETESLPTEHESSSPGGKDIFDAIKESLNYAHKENAAANQTHLPDGSTESAASFPYLSNSDADDDDDDDDDDEEISIFDYFLNGDKHSSTTPEPPIGFNVTGKPLGNGFTNSPMHIEPVIPDMQNESVKFAMLPMSLYNMINDDGVLMFDKSATTEHDTAAAQTTEKAAAKTTQASTTTKQPAKVTTAKEPTTAKKGVSSTLPSPATSKTALKTTTTTTTRQPDKKVTVPSKLATPLATSKVTPVIRPSTIETVRIKSTASTPPPKITEATTQKPVASTAKAVTAAKATKSPAKIPTTPSTPPSTTPTATKAPAPPSTSPTTTTTHAPPPPTISTTALPRLVTKKKSSVKNSTSVHQLLTTKTTRVPSTTPKIIAIPLNSNVANVEHDINYDYGDPTLPPSLPNLKIIPFLPTDAVRNSIHNGDGYHVQPDYYVQPNGHQHPVESHADTSYSPFNVKPDREHLSYYSSGAADDRIDYDSYKPAPENIANANYRPDIYHPPASHAPVAINVHVNSKLDYQHGPTKVSAPTSTANRNLTVKPPLPPFEPEHLYNIPQPIQLHPDNEYVQYHVNGADEAIEAPTYPSEHSYEIPQFVAIPPVKETQRPAGQSSFSYKNKFSPPVQTEGGFIPKRPINENYIPLHGTNYFEDNLDMNLAKTASNASAILDSLAEKNAQSSEIGYFPAYLHKSDDVLEPDDIRADVHLTHTPGLHLGDIFEIPPANAKHHEMNDVFPQYTVEHREPQKPSPPTTTSAATTAPTTSTSQHAAFKGTKQPSQSNPTIPLKLITILHNTKKESPTKVEPPQRKNNKIIDPTNEPLDDIPSTSAMPSTAAPEQESDEGLTALREAFLSSLNLNTDISDQVLHTSQIFAHRPAANQLSPSYVGGSHFPSNAIESKHSYQSSPIRSELYLIVPELNKNQGVNDLSHTNNYSSEKNYQVLPNDDAYLANTESYVVNPVDVDKLKGGISGETKIFSPPHKDPMSLLKLSGCNIYGRMYHVGRVITELSSPCLECRCTEVGVSCSPLAC